MFWIVLVSYLFLTASLKEKHCILVPLGIQSTHFTVLQKRHGKQCFQWEAPRGKGTRIHLGRTRSLAGLWDDSRTRSEHEAMQLWGELRSWSAIHGGHV